MALNKLSKKNGETWKHALKAKNYKLDIELSHEEIKYIIAGLHHFNDYLSKEKRYEERQKNEKLLNDFKDFDSYIINNY